MTGGAGLDAVRGGGVRTLGSVTPPTTAPDLAAVDLVAVLELRRVRLALREPFVAAHGTEHDREVVLVHAIGHDGRHGWGECVALSAPTYTAETTSTAWRALRDVLAPGFLSGSRVVAAEHPMAWTALETALVDLELRRTGRTLVAALGAEPRLLDACAVVGLHATVDDTVRAVARRVERGHRSVKLKIEPGRDLDRLLAVRSTYPDLGLAVDANGSYASADRAQLARIAALGLLYIEQPLPAADLDALAALAPHLAAPVALDESVGSPADLDRAIAAGAGTVVNVKPGRVGGLAASLAVLARAHGAGLAAFVGGMLETGVGRATALAVASLDACTLPTDLGPSSRYFADDVTAPIELVEAGRLRVPDGPGIGVVPRMDRLDAVTVDRVVVRR